MYKNIFSEPVYFFTQDGKKYIRIHPTKYIIHIFIHPSSSAHHLTSPKQQASFREHYCSLAMSDANFNTLKSMMVACGRNAVNDWARVYVPENLRPVTLSALEFFSGTSDGRSRVVKGTKYVGSHIRAGLSFMNHFGRGRDMRTIQEASKQELIEEKAEPVVRAVAEKEPGPTPFTCLYSFEVVMT